MKAQAVRLLDVFALGPLMVWVADHTRGAVPTWARVALLISGQLTIVYNAHNYGRQRWGGKHLPVVS